MVDPAVVALPEAGVDDVFPDLDPEPGLVLLAPDGAHDLGPPTVDSDLDGRPDTAVLAEPDALVLATDLDGDADVDVITTLHGDGVAETHDVADPWDEGVPPPAPTIDPASGRWVRGG